MTKKLITSSYSKLKSQNGFAAITSLLIISVVGLSLAISISLLGVGEAQNALGYKKGWEAFTAAKGCSEEALQKVKNDGTYTGESLQLGNTSCTITVSGAGSNKTILVVATLSGPPDFTRRLQLTIKRTGNGVSLLTSQEIP